MMPRIIPVLLLQNNGLVKTSRFKNPVYIGDPINAVKIFNEKRADELIFLDIDASKNNTPPDFDYISTIATECFMPFAYGGGVRSYEDAKRIFESGAEKIILNSILFDKPDLVQEIVSTYGQQSVVAAIDIKKGLTGKYLVYRHQNQTTEKTPPLEWIRKVVDLGVGEIMITSIDREGTGKGYDLDFFKQIKDCDIPVPVVANGGANGIQDFKDVLSMGTVDAVAAGSFFVFQGKHRAVLITYPKASETKEILSI
jgi:cyclase